MPCRATVRSEFGLKAFRRPLTRQRGARYGFSRGGRADQNFIAGRQMVVEAMLQSPHFLFRVEADRDGRMRKFEIASRLSYFLWDTMPGDDLFARREAGELATPSRSRSRRGACSTTPAPRQSMDEFLAQWMRFDRVLEASRDRRRFPEFNAEIAAPWSRRRGALQSPGLGRRNFMEFFTADYTFVNQRPRPALRPAGARRGIRAGGVSGGFRACRRAGAGQFPGVDQQARRNLADGARAVRPEPFSRPGNPDRLRPA